MKKILSALLLLVLIPGRADDAVLLSSDESSQLFLVGAPARDPYLAGLSFSIKEVYRSTRDMMGLSYDASLRRYVMDCVAGTVLFRQQFLLAGEQVVWTFPESVKPLAASRELPEVVSDHVCRLQSSGAR